MAKRPPAPPPPTPAAGRARLLRWALVIPLELAVVAYTRVLGGEFQLDDYLTIQANPVIRSLGGALRALVLAPGSRPLTDLTFALGFAAGGLEPFGHHLVNLLLHLAAVVLVHALARRLLVRAGARSPDGVALAAAGAWAVHPLLSQAVSYVTQRAELLASLWYVGGLLALLATDGAAAEAAGRARAARAWALACACFLAGLLSKQIVVTLPAAWVLVALALPGPEPRPPGARLRRALRQIAPLAVVGALFAWWTLAGLRGLPHAGFDVPGLPPAAYALTQLRVVLLYLRLLLWPAGQNLDHAVAVSTGPDGPTALAGALVLSLVGAALWLLARAGRWAPPERAAARLAGLGVLWFFLLLSPTSSVVPLADVAFEHRAYLAAFGPVLGLAAAAELLVARLPVRAARVAGPALALAAWGSLALALHERNAVWETGLALWGDVVAKSPGLSRGHMNLGHAQAQAGELEAAAASFRRALSLPTDARIRPAEMRRNLLAVLSRLGRLDEAREVSRQALAEEPDDPELLNGAAILEGLQGRPAEAEALARKALERRPGSLNALTTLGEARLAQGDAAGALAAFEQAVALDLDDTGFRHLNVARALQKLGRAEAACAAAGRARRAERDPERRRGMDRVAAGMGCGP